MIRLLIPIILIVLALTLARRYINTAPVGQRGSRKVTVLLIALIIGLLVLVLLHRMHWLGPIVPSIILAGHKLKEFLSGRKDSNKNNPE